MQEVRGKKELLSLPDGATATIEFRGEAIRVDLGDGKALFVLVQPAERTEETLVPIVDAALDPAYTRGGVGNVESIRRISRGRASSEASLSTANSQLRFVTVLDEAQRETVQAVAPDAIGTTFGDGYILR